MKKPVYLFLIIIGILSIISSVYLAFTGAEFEQYFFGIFIGFTLVGVTYFNNKRKQEEKN